MSKIKSNKKTLSPEQREELFKALKARFDKNMKRHNGIAWTKVQAKLEADSEKLWSLNEMERTGGEPDVVGFDNLPADRQERQGEYTFYDCSAESPKERRSLCYDREALDAPFLGGCPHPTFLNKYYLSLIWIMLLNMQVKEKVINHLMKFTSGRQ
jgi:hypothetical protein